MTESILNVPLKPATREWLKARSEASGRAERREAQAIIERAKARDVKKA